MLDELRGVAGNSRDQDLPALWETKGSPQALSNTLAPGISKNETVMANPPLPRLSRESQRWVLQRYSFGYEHITEEWVGYDDARGRTTQISANLI